MRSAQARHAAVQGWTPGCMDVAKVSGSTGGSGAYRLQEQHQNMDRQAAARRNVTGTKPSKEHTQQAKQRALPSTHPGRRGCRLRPLNRPPGQRHQHIALAAHICQLGGALAQHTTTVHLQAGGSGGARAEWQVAFITAGAQPAAASLPPSGLPASFSHSYQPQPLGIALSQLAAVSKQVKQCRKTALTVSVHRLRHRVA